MLSDNDLCVVPSLDGINIQLQLGNETQVQFSSPIGKMIETQKFNSVGDLLPGKTLKSDVYLARLDELCARYGSALNVRFYGFYSEIFDARILNRLPNIRSLTVNCLSEACHLETIGEIKHLEDLSLGVFDLQQKDILHALPLKSLKTLTLEETNTKALDLAPLAEAHDLRQLRLFGQKKNIEVIGGLAQLEEFVFNPAKGKSLEYLNGMTNLQTLKLILGGCENFNEVKLGKLKDLAVTQVRGLSTLGDLTRFSLLERLLVQDQIQLQSVAFTSQISNLRHIWFNNCKILDALPGLNTLPKLTSLSAYQTALSIDMLTMPKSLTHAYIHSGRLRTEQAETASIVALGLRDEMHPDASFFFK